MTLSFMKRIGIIAGAALVWLVAWELVASRNLPTPLEVARRHCAEQGTPAAEPSLLGYRASGGPLGKNATIEFSV